jgi:hypothetical protein
MGRSDLPKMHWRNLDTREAPRLTDSLMMHYPLVISAGIVLESKLWLARLLMLFRGL